MAEESKGIRLKKAATELNVGISTLVEFLAKKGHQVETNPNTRLSAEQYDLVAAAFQSEREVKEQADKIEIMSNVNNVVIEAEPEENKEENEEVIIKNYNASNIENKGGKQPAETAVTPDEPEAPEVSDEPDEPEIPQAEEPVRQEAPAPEPEVETIEVEAVEPEPEPEPEPETPAFTPTTVGDLRIVDKIDLSSINTKMRPDKKKKSKAEKAEKNDKQEKTDKEKNNKKADKAKESAKTPAEPAKKVVAPKPAPVPAPQVPEAPAPVKAEPEFIETQYQKL